MTANFGGVHVVPLLGAIAGCQFLFHILFYFQLLADVALFSTLMTQKLVLAIWGLCWYNLFKGTAWF